MGFDILNLLYQQQELISDKIFHEKQISPTIF